MRFYLLLFVFVISVLIDELRAEDVDLDVVENKVFVDTTFNGSKINIYGATEKREGIVVVISGPLENYSLQKSINKAGIWVDSNLKKFNNVPSFIAILSNGKIYDFNIIKDINFSKKIDVTILTSKDWNNFINVKEKKKHYIRKFDAIKNSGKYLFKTSIDLPDDIVTGEYDVYTFVDENGKLKLIDESKKISIERVGFVNFIYNMANNNSYIYAIITIIVSFIMGYLLIKIKE